MGGRQLSYNRNAPLGALRSNAGSISSLLKVNILDDIGLAIRTSVLNIDSRPQTDQPITVQCHNGSVSEAIAITFWRKVAGQLTKAIVTLSNT